jgi:hypothetical protein
VRYSSNKKLNKNFASVYNSILLHSTSTQNNENEMSKKQLFTIEYPIRCSPSILYEFLSTPAGLQEWFADKVDERDNIFSFSWNGSIEKAEIMEGEELKFVRYHWVDTPKEEFFEFRIEKSEVTNQTILIIKDFADKKDIKDQSQLWNYQIKDLMHRIGS